MRFEIVEVEQIPDSLEEGKIYISYLYQTTSHLCPCGCKQEVPIPIGVGIDSWMATVEGDLITLEPSLKMRFECKSHYFIRKSEVVWA